MASRARQDFVDTSVTGTLNLPEAALAAGLRAFVITRTTRTIGAFGGAMRAPPGAPAETSAARWRARLGAKGRRRSA